MSQNPQRLNSLRILCVLIIVAFIVSCISCAYTGLIANEVSVKKPQFEEIQPGPTGTWYVNANGDRYKISIANYNGSFTGTLIANKGEVETLDSISWNQDNQILEFKRQTPDGPQWYKIVIKEGIMVGRYSHVDTTAINKPTDPTKYARVITGWNFEYLTPPDAPLVFDIVLEDSRRGKLRIGRLSDSGYIGRFKYYAIGNSLLELPEEEISIHSFEDNNINFSVANRQYNGFIDGPDISGTMRVDEKTLSWKGKRAEVLTYGITHRSTQQQASWQNQTRAQLFHLLMSNNPQPLSTTTRMVRENIEPFTGTDIGKRDDTPALFPQYYKLTEVEFSYTLPNPMGIGKLTRNTHAYIAKPISPAANGFSKYPLVIALNGHNGSSYSVMLPDSSYSYGDIFARREYMVLAVDISHRPPADRIRYGTPSDFSSYQGYGNGAEKGDDPDHGNGAHPSIKPPKPDGFTDEQWANYSDWEEEGERAWDAMRALDYALSRNDVDPNRIIITGLSMGGEVSSYVMALDTRVSMGVHAGYSPDFDVLMYLGSHGCWNWAYSNIREYISQSDLLALSAPRPLIVETGKLDIGFSNFPQNDDILSPVTSYSAPYASDKQVLRRARAAYQDFPSLIIHFLHNGAHEYRTAVTDEGGIQTPVIIEPRVTSDLYWQTDNQTKTEKPNLFDLIKEYIF